MACLVAALFLGLAALASASRLPTGLVAASERRLRQGEPTEPIGFWHSVQAVSAAGSPYCGLRDFPPIPDGYGQSRMLCGGVEAAAYDVYWKWAFTKTAGDLSTILTGDSLNLRLFNPMLTYCRTATGGQVKCGVDFTSASIFTVEKVGAPGNGLLVDFNADKLFLKSGGKYCKINGKGSSAYVYCSNPTPAGATVFKFPVTSYAPVTITSVLSQLPCGADFIPQSFTPPVVYCNSSNAIPSNFYKSFVASAQVPGLTSDGLVSGGSYAFTDYDELYHYQFAAWGTMNATGAVVSLNNDEARPASAKIFFTLDKLGGEPGEPLYNGDPITIKSVLTGNFCGIASTASTLMCNYPVFNPKNVFLFGLPSF